MPIRELCDAVVLEKKAEIEWNRKKCKSENPYLYRYSRYSRRSILLLPSQ